MSDSSMRAKPSMAEPSKPMPSSSAFSSSSIVIAKLFRKPRMSVNQSRMNRTSCSLASRSTYSLSLRRGRVLGLAGMAGSPWVLRRGTQFAERGRGVMRELLEAPDVLGALPLDRHRVNDTRECRELGPVHRCPHPRPHDRLRHLKVELQGVGVVAPSETLLQAQ